MFFFLQQQGNLFCGSKVFLGEAIPTDLLKGTSQSTAHWKNLYFRAFANFGKHLCTNRGSTIWSPQMLLLHVFWHSRVGCLCTQKTNTDKDNSTVTIPVAVAAVDRDPNKHSQSLAYCSLKTHDMMGVGSLYAIQTFGFSKRPHNKEPQVLDVLMN